MIESKGHKITPIDGDLDVSRNAEIGGDADIHGKARVAGSLKVEGFLDAPNIKGAVKGLFATEEELKREYPNPRPGWCAIVLADKESGFLYLAKNREWEKQSEEAQPFDFITDSVNVFASKSELVDVKEKTESNKDAINELNTAIDELNTVISDEIVRAVEREDGIARKALKADTAFASPNTKVVNVWGKSVDGSSDMSITISAATTEKAGVMSAEDKRNLNNSTVKVITWNNDTDPSDMDDFVVAGVYELKGERTRDDDNLPFGNTGGGHTFHARLEVLDSSITPEGKSDDICITQKLTLSNRVAGDGDVYIRTGRGTSKQSITWEAWGKLQQNVEVGEVDNLDALIDNGIYSGVWTTGSFINTGYPTTFVCVVINDYFLGKELNNYQRKISQFVYGVTALDGSTGFRYRVKIGDNGWGNWEILNKSEIDNAFKNFRDGLEQTINGIVATLSTKIDSVKRNAAHYNKIGFNTYTDEVELYVRNIADDDVRTDTIPAATNEKAGVMSADDKKKLEDTSKEIVNIKDGNTIVGQAREIHSRNGKTVTDSFLARTTAGSGTIGDGVATLKSVGGNIVKNLVNSVSTDGWKSVGGTVAISQNNGIFVLQDVKGADYCTASWNNLLDNVFRISNHIYYYSCGIKAKNIINQGEGDKYDIVFGVTNTKGIPLKYSPQSIASAIAKSSEEWQRLSFVIGKEPNSDYYGCALADIRADRTTPVYAKDFMCIDLTEMFGAGNEPTLAECDKLFATMDALPQGLTIAKPAVFTSTGFNQFNPENVLEGKAIVDNAIGNGDKKIAVIPCLPCKVGIGENNGYCIHGDFGNDINVYLTPLNPMEVAGELYMHKLTKDSSTDTYVPQIKGYMLVEVPTTANLCAHFLWSEDKCERDSYEPYFESKVELPVIPQMSEYGLAGIQSSGTLACDEIDFERGVYVKKIGAVDMGSLKWDYDTHGYCVVNTPLTDVKRPEYRRTANAVIANYTIKRAFGVASEEIPDKQFMIYSGGQFYFKDTAYTSAASFKQAMQGVTLYYELATPEEYPLPKFDNNYISSDYGVEQFDSSIPCNANNLYYMRSLAGETRNFLDRLMTGLGTSDATVVADRILAVVNPTVEPANVEPETPIEE